MIQIRRGKTASWKSLKTPLAAGQPGYDKDKHKIKIGDGKTLWEKLPYAGGVSEDEILDSETHAKQRLATDPESLAIITYGPNSPDKRTVGQLYLQYYDTEPEADYVIAAGIDRGWRYQIWKSGFASCVKTFEVSTSVQTAIGNGVLYQNSTALERIQYPFTFKEIPSETATVQSPAGVVWLASAKGYNSKKESAAYTLISTNKLKDAAKYRISIKVDGIINEAEDDRS